MVKPDKKIFSSGWIPKRSSGWLLLLLFVSAWMFFLGVLVGRGTAPIKFDIDKLQKELASLKADDIKEQLNRVEIGSDSGKLKKDLGFYEALKDTKDDSKKSSNRKPNKTAGKSSSSSKTGARVKKKVNPSKNSQNHTSPKPEKAPIDKSIESPKNLTIQAASFKDPKDADKMVAMLKKKGYPAYRIIGVVPEKGVWYRVRIGYYSSGTEAAAMIKKLQKGGLKPFLVNR
jgi:cell division septation protein DedD